MDRTNCLLRFGLLPSSVPPRRYGFLDTLPLRRIRLQKSEGYTNSLTCATTLGARFAYEPRRAAPPTSSSTPSSHRECCSSYASATSRPVSMSLCARTPLPESLWHRDGVLIVPRSILNSVFYVFIIWLLQVVFDYGRFPLRTKSMTCIRCSYQSRDYGTFEHFTTCDHPVLQQPYHHASRLSCSACASLSHAQVA